MQELYLKERNWIHVKQTISEDRVGVVQVNNMMLFQTKHYHLKSIHVRVVWSNVMEIMETITVFAAWPKHK